jgi:hypothetical protein
VDPGDWALGVVLPPSLPHLLLHSFLCLGFVLSVRLGLKHVSDGQKTYKNRDLVKTSVVSDEPKKAAGGGGGGGGAGKKAGKKALPPKFEYVLSGMCVHVYVVCACVLGRVQTHVVLRPPSRSCSS